MTHPSVGERPDIETTLREQLSFDEEQLFELRFLFFKKLLAAFVILGFMALDLFCLGTETYRSRYSLPADAPAYVFFYLGMGLLILIIGLFWIVSLSKAALLIRRRAAAQKQVVTPAMGASSKPGSGAADSSVDELRFEADKTSAMLRRLGSVDTTASWSSESIAAAFGGGVGLACACVAAPSPQGALYALVVALPLAGAAAAVLTQRWVSGRTSASPSGGPRQAEGVAALRRDEAPKRDQTFNSEDDCNSDDA
jgi:hypothetical protein